MEILRITADNGSQEARAIMIIFSPLKCQAMRTRDLCGMINLWLHRKDVNGTGTEHFFRLIQFSMFRIQKFLINSHVIQAARTNTVEKNFSYRFRYFSNSHFSKFTRLEHHSNSKLLVWLNLDNLLIQFSWESQPKANYYDIQAFLRYVTIF